MPISFPNLEHILYGHSPRRFVPAVSDVLIQGDHAWAATVMNEVLPTGGDFVLLSPRALPPMDESRAWSVRSSLSAPIQPSTYVFRTPDWESELTEERQRGLAGPLGSIVAGWRDRAREVPGSRFIVSTPHIPQSYFDAWSTYLHQTTVSEALSHGAAKVEERLNALPKWTAMAWNKRTDTWSEIGSRALREAA
ncbi:hypothetical protein GCM10025867_50640 (plasmid) [Frondihabitans sucicola]|uniref:Uncharacterized protein n=1 Tax=Frondihabitans sucicola TaxID=1268041 RepID=A0ABN6YBX5_9MICO|nr:hypothetical protein GCM10025867_50640 [Frondihabitans sucicola]